MINSTLNALLASQVKPLVDALDSLLDLTYEINKKISNVDSSPSTEQDMARKALQDAKQCLEAVE